jgi:hypothetical protein
VPAPPAPRKRRPQITGTINADRLTRTAPCQRLGRAAAWSGDPPEADALRFNPWNTGGGLAPAGLLNRLRDYAYPLSQRAWARTGRAGRQAAADAAVARRGASRTT